MTWLVDLPNKSMDELWAAAEGAVALRSGGYGMMWGLYVHTGVGWQVVADITRRRELTDTKRIRGKGLHPRRALLDFLSEMEQDWLANPPHRFEWQD